MKIEVHILCYNEFRMLPFALLHYAEFASRIVIHDSFSTDGTRDVIKQWMKRPYYRGVPVECRDWDTGGRLNDELARQLKNSCWRGADATWVILVDCDELVLFPRGVIETLTAHKDKAIIRPQGWELYADEFPRDQSQLIWAQVKTGARDDYWYGKPVILQPRLISWIQYHAGAHDAIVLLKDGTDINSMRDWDPPTPVTYLLHCKHLGPIKTIAKAYDEKRTRLAPINVEKGWGNFKPGMVHAQEKREWILNHLQKIPLL